MYDFLDKIGLKAVLEAIKGKIPTSLPANGGNADTVGDRHASEFALASTLQQVMNSRVEIPDNVNVGEWLVQNAKIGTQYFRTDGTVGQTNLPGGLNTWMWFSYDGNRYFARAWTADNGTTEFILNNVNSVGEWKEIYTSDNKLHVTGVVVVDSNGKANVSFGFKPSFVLYEPTSPKSGIFGSVYSATTFDATGFTPSADTYTGGLTGNGFSYIAFK